MYPKKQIIGVSHSAPSVLNPFCPDCRIARPLSYYVRGGVDLDGVSNRPPLPGYGDSAEDIATGDVDMARNPRVSRFDIADTAQYAATETEARIAEDLAQTK